MARVAVRVQPRSRGNEIRGQQSGAIVVRLTAPPVEGKANQALVDYLADRLGVARGAVSIASGHNSRRKLVEVEGLSQEEILSRLGLGLSLGAT